MSSFAEGDWRGFARRWLRLDMGPKPVWSKIDPSSAGTARPRFA